MDSAWWHTYQSFKFLSQNFITKALITMTLWPLGLLRGLVSGLSLRIRVWGLGGDYIGDIYIAPEIWITLSGLATLKTQKYVLSYIAETIYYVLKCIKIFSTKHITYLVVQRKDVVFGLKHSGCNIGIISLWIYFLYAVGGGGGGQREIFLSSHELKSVKIKSGIFNAATQIPCSLYSEKSLNTHAGSLVFHVKL